MRSLGIVCMALCAGKEILRVFGGGGLEELGGCRIGGLVRRMVEGGVEVGEVLQGMVAEEEVGRGMEEYEEEYEVKEDPLAIERRSDGVTFSARKQPINRLEDVKRL